MSGRKLCAKLDISPTYLSKISSDAMPASASLLKNIAKALDINADTLLAIAGKIDPDLVPLINYWPLEIPAMIRATVGMSAEDLCRVLGYMDALKRDRQRIKHVSA